MRTNGLRSLGLALPALLALASAVRADGPLMPRQALPKYTQECAACHLAYPPALLPAASWQRIMAGLDRHYGVDASLDAASVREIGAWLQANAGGYKRVRSEPPQDRITRSDWFERKHRDVADAVWQRASVKSRANCMACHTQADRGDFDDDRVRIPR